MQDISLDRGADPPHGVSRKPEPAIRVKTRDRLHHADIALGDQLRKRETVAAIAHRDLGDEAEVASDELVRGLRILVLFPTLGEHVFLPRLQHRKFADLLKIPRQVSFRGDGRNGKGGHRRLVLRLKSVKCKRWRECRDPAPIPPRAYPTKIV